MGLFFFLFWGKKGLKSKRKFHFFGQKEALKLKMRNKRYLCAQRKRCLCQMKFDIWLFFIHLTNWNISYIHSSQIMALPTHVLLEKQYGRNFLLLFLMINLTSKSFIVYTYTVQNKSNVVKNLPYSTKTLFFFIYFVGSYLCSFALGDRIKQDFFVCLFFTVIKTLIYFNISGISVSRGMYS